MKKSDAGIWTFDTRDLMRVSNCLHCTQQSILRCLQSPAALAVLQKYIDEARLKPQNLAMKYGNRFESLIEQELVASCATGDVQKPAVSTFAETLNLMALGVPVIYQGALAHNSDVATFSGRPDFLVRSDWRLEFVGGKLTAKQVGELGGTPAYNAWDAKYGTKAKAEYALQVAIYIAALQQAGFKGEGPHGLILGNRTLSEFEESEIAGAMEISRQELEKQILGLDGLSPEKLEDFAEGFTWHCSKTSDCDICEYPELCDASRHETDDLTLIHNIRGNQREKLVEAGIHTVKQFVETPDEMRPESLTEKIWNTHKAQARLQVQSRELGTPVHRLLPDPALAFLPPKAAGDVFFDLEGFTYYEEAGGLEYLWGYWTREDGFGHTWANNRSEEKDAFAQLMNWLINHLANHPDAHVYHYNAYEVTASNRVSSRHGIFEAEVAQLIEDKRFVDLQPLVSKSLMVGEESYSIKKLERHYGFVRSAEVKKATDSMDGFEEYSTALALANNVAADPAERAEAAEAAKQLKSDLLSYNCEDVVSTEALYNWLAGMPGATERFGEDTSPKEDSDGEESAAAQSLKELVAKTANLFVPLNEWIAKNGGKLDQPALAWAALTHSILFYRREDATFWADMHVRLQKDNHDIELDRKAALLRAAREIDRSMSVNKDGKATVTVTVDAEIDPEGTFTPEPKDDIIVRIDLAGNRFERRFGKVVSYYGGFIQFTYTCKPHEKAWPASAIFEYAPFRGKPKQDSINTLAEEVTAEWHSPASIAPAGYPALDLLFRRSPRLKGNASLPTADPNNYLPSVIRAIDLLDNSILAIQGPPGSGKTYLASRTIAHLVGQGKRVGVVAMSHNASENLLTACLDAGIPSEGIFKVSKDGDDRVKPWRAPGSPKTLGSQISKVPGAVVVGGTAWTFCNANVIARQFDYLFIDEAAQFSMVDALAVSRSAKNLVLLGDPRQLSQVVNAVHPGGVENSALGHYMGNHAILPKDKGYFVEVTRRLHPNVNAPVSWLAYQGKLRSHVQTENNEVSGIESGLHHVPVTHHWNSTRSNEEVAKVLELAMRYSAEVGQSEVLVVSPYNAQVDAIKEALDQAQLNQVEVGTVDRFQGREGQVVIISLSASSAVDAPRGLEFLLERNRLNVAISRAKSLCFLVYSPALLTGGFKSLEELKGVSRLAGLLKFA